MVGMLGLGSRHPSPRSDSPRAEQSHLVPVDGGHFFSLPHWTRRILPVSPIARKSHDHTPNLCGAPPRRLLLEKDLPPIPSPQADPSIPSHGPSPHPNAPRVSITVQHATDSPPRSTPHLDVYHSIPITPPPSQINSVAFTSSQNGCTENAVRKTKSTHSLRPQQPSSSLEKQRARGVSMTHLFGTVKRVSTSPSPSTGSSPATPLVRKSSFWSRKLPTASPQHLTVPAEPPSLSAPTAPFPLRVDFIAPPDSSAARPRSSPGSARSLFRRHSERALRQHSAARTDIPSLPQSSVAPDKSNVRPSTADPYLFTSQHSLPRRPTTADSSGPSHSRSLFTLPRSSTVPSPDDDPLTIGPTPRPENGPRTSRPRSSTNPPLLHRLSVNLFSSSPPSANKNGSFFSNGIVSSPTSRSPRPSLSQIPPDALRPRAGESSETFLHRLVALVSKAEIAGVLASSGHPVHADSLRLFIDRFEFCGDPLDVALRRLLMNVGLPRETQQIDRVMEAFANRYLACNPDLFTSRDHPYILAFSLIMLHTDAFNKSNRRKMSKADYMRNTTLPGLIPEVLDCFYDNIVFAPFIFIEDPLDPEGGVEGNLTRPSTSSGLSSPLIQSGNILLTRPKIDPYYLIKNNLLDQLRLNVEGQIPPENPFRWDGTGNSWNYDEILLDFARGYVVQIGLAETRSTTPFFGLSAGGMPSPSLHALGNTPETPPASETWTIKFTKVAVLNRKDDPLDGGKKPLNRKWRPYSVALTRSSILLFRDLSWASALHSWKGEPRQTPIPSTSFKPDEIISLNGTLAVLDRSYSKHLHTFRLATRDGRRILFQTTEEKEMNEWISRINYASAFKTTGVYMRSLGMTGKALELTGVAAAASHLYDLQLPNFGQPRTLNWSRKPSESMGGPPHSSSSHDGCYVDMDGCRGEFADPSAPEVDGTSQFKETFDTVKAELVAARISAGDLSVVEKAHPVGAESPRLASRSHTIHTRVEDLEERICEANAQIDSSIHIARNIAILAPFQKSTRDRLQDTVQALSKKLQAMRLDVTKLICHRNILLNDLAAEEKNFKQATSLALQAATETLQHHYSEYALRPSFSSQEHRSKRSTQEGSPPSGSQSFDSSAYEAFRSALDFGPDWPSSGETFATSSLLGRSIDSPVTQGFDTSTGGCPSPDETSHLSLSIINQSLPDASLHENPLAVPDFPEEQAEEWSKTRAAKRVSLVKLPSDLRMSLIAGKSSRHPQGNSEPLEEEPYVVGDT